MRSQPRIRGKRREPLPSSVTSKIWDAVHRDSLRWKCSRSWIIATALAAFYGIDIIEPYETKRKKKAA